MNIDYRLLIDYLKKSLKFIIISTIVTSTLGLVYLLTETPKYEVSTVIAANEDENQVGFDSKTVGAEVSYRLAPGLR